MPSACLPTEYAGSSALEHPSSGGSNEVGVHGSPRIRTFDRRSGGIEAANDLLVMNAVVVRILLPREGKSGVDQFSSPEAPPRSRIALDPSELTAAIPLESVLRVVEQRVDVAVGIRTSRDEAAVDGRSGEFPNAHAGPRRIEVLREPVESVRTRWGGTSATRDRLLDLTPFGRPEREQGVAGWEGHVCHKAPIWAEATKRLDNFPIAAQAKLDVVSGANA
jgi:hypothetical protein